MRLPEDPMMLLSYVNTQLRDNYPDLDELCAALGIGREQIEEKLKAVDYVYDEARNRFA